MDEQELLGMCVNCLRRKIGACKGSFMKASCSERVLDYDTVQD